MTVSPKVEVSPARLLGVRTLHYLTNHIVNRIPSFRLRHGWYRRILGISIGENAGISLGCYVWYYGRSDLRRTGCHVGKNTKIDRDCCLDARGSLTIGENVSVAAEVTILTTQHGHNARGFPLESLPVVIEDHAWIGMRAIILPGTVVGRGAVVAAGAVARGTIPPLTIVAGVPARPVGQRQPEGLDYELNSSPPLFE